MEETIGIPTTGKEIPVGIKIVENVLENGKIVAKRDAKKEDISEADEAKGRRTVLQVPVVSQISYKVFKKGVLENFLVVDLNITT